MRGDDGAGAAVAELLWLQRDRARELADANFVLAHQLTPELALDLSEAAFALFNDAACDGRPAGSITTVGLEVVLAAEEPTTLVTVGSGCWQDPTPVGLLALARQLYGRAAPAVLVGISVGYVGMGVGLSPLVEAAVPVAASTARLVIKAFNDGVPGPVHAVAARA